MLLTETLPSRQVTQILAQRDDGIDKEKSGKKYFKVIPDKRV